MGAAPGNPEDAGANGPEVQCDVPTVLPAAAVRHFSGKRHLLAIVKYAGLEKPLSHELRSRGGKLSSKEMGLTQKAH
jgi:hypothetical protein